jgi:hypothetical protein
MPFAEMYHGPLDGRCEERLQARASPADIPDTDAPEMWNRVKQFFGNGTATSASPSAISGPGLESTHFARPAPPATDRAPAGAETTLLPSRLVEFLDTLSSGTAPPAAETLTGDDILFLEGLVNRLLKAQLELARLPDATLRLTEMLRHGDVPVARYAELIEQDTSLSVEVLKAANAACYAASAPTGSLQQAIMRIGLTRLQGILMLTLMKSRVLRAGTLRGHAEALMEMALPLASVASTLARVTGRPADVPFMRGMLLHVEHLVVLGTVGDTSREHRAIVTPSIGALLLAFDRSGPDVRHALAYAWELEDILTGREGDTDTIDYAQLRRAIVCRWLRLPLPAVDGVPAALLSETLAAVPPRVAPPAEDTPPLDASMREEQPRSDSHAGARLRAIE